jgi:predicted heme/steroid binding protein
MKKFTKEELARYDGKKSQLICIAYKGKVYDLTGSFLWQKGKHQVFHGAGKDLTEVLKDAPHGEEMILKFPMVGILLDKKS